MSWPIPIYSLRWPSQVLDSMGIPRQTPQQIGARRLADIQRYLAKGVANRESDSNNIHGGSRVETRGDMDGA